MGFFKKTAEYNKLAQSFNGLYPMIQELNAKTSDEEIKEDLLLLAYIGRINIIDRMETYNWNYNGSIVVPSMPGRKTTLINAFNLTIGMITHMADELGIENQNPGIFDQDDFFYDLEKNIPSYIKNLIN